MMGSKTITYSEADITGAGGSHAFQKRLLEVLDVR